MKPLRRCTGCFEMKEKSELVRVVKMPSGEISVDSTGKKAGRGAYVCSNVLCFETSRKKKGLDRSLKQVVPARIYEDIKDV